MGNYRNFKLVVYFVAHGTITETREKPEKELAFFKRHMRLDKVYLEPFRSGDFASHEQVELCRAVFEENGVEVAGGITTTIRTPEGDAPKQRLFDTFCYNDPKMVAKLKEVCTFLGEHFNEFIIDDFFFTNCTCEACRAGRDAFNAKHGITDGSWQEYRLDLMQKVSQECIIGPAHAANPAIQITIKYPNWAESYQETGYNPAQQRTIFDNIYTGTETRDYVTTDQHLPRYLSYSLMTYFENMWPGHNGGGWFDPFDLHVMEQYLEQAYLTAFSKPKELMMFCFQALVDTMRVPALGYQLDKLDEVLDYAGNPIGINCYLPDNSQGEDNIQDFLGMVGFPIVCTPYFPEKAPVILLTRASAYDPEIVDKLEKYVAEGGKAIVTNGFVEATADRGIYRITSIRMRGRRISGRDYRIETLEQGGRTLLTFPHGREEITVPVAEFRNNATWALVKVGSGQESYGILLKDTYGKGQMYTLTVPDSFPDVYKLPVEVLTRLHAEFPVGDVYLEAGPQTSLFMYDNDSFIVYPYVEWGAQPAMARIHVKGQVNALVAPTQKDRHGDPVYLEPLYTTEDETVFEIYTMPGQYVIYQIDRN